MVYEATITFTGIDFKKKARNVGFIMNNNLSSAHINEVCKIATPIIRMFTWLINALVISRLDYCNSVLYGIP